MSWGSVLALIIVPLVRLVSTTLSVPEDALLNEAPVFVRFAPSPTNDVAVTMPWNSAPAFATISPLLKIVAPAPIGVSAPRTFTPAISIPTLCKLDVPVLNWSAVDIPVAFVLPVISRWPVPVIDLFNKSKLPPSWGLVSLTSSARTVTVATPAAPVLAITLNPLEPLKSSEDILPAVPTTVPSVPLTVRPPIAPVPAAVIPDKLEPSP